MTADQRLALIEERTELQDLLGDIATAADGLERAVNKTCRGRSSAKAGLVSMSFAYQTLGVAMRFRAERGLFSKS